MEKLILIGITLGVIAVSVLIWGNNNPVEKVAETILDLELPVSTLDFPTNDLRIPAVHMSLSAMNPE